LLINLSCKSASKPLNVALEEEVIAAAITIALILYLRASDTGSRHGEVPPRGELKSARPPSKNCRPPKSDGNSCIIIGLF